MAQDDAQSVVHGAAASEALVLRSQLEEGKKQYRAADKRGARLTATLSAMSGAALATSAFLLGFTPGVIMLGGLLGGVFAGIGSILTARVRDIRMNDRLAELHRQLSETQHQARQDRLNDVPPRVAALLRSRLENDTEDDSSEPMGSLALA